MPNTLCKWSIFDVARTSKCPVQFIGMSQKVRKLGLLRSMSVAEISGSTSKIRNIRNRRSRRRPARVATTAKSFPAKSLDLLGFEADRSLKRKTSFSSAPIETVSKKRNHVSKLWGYSEFCTSYVRPVGCKKISRNDSGLGGLQDFGRDAFANILRNVS